MKLLTTVLGLTTVLSAQTVEPPLIVEAPNGLYIQRNVSDRLNCPGPGFPVFEHLVGAFGFNGKIFANAYVEVDPCEPQDAVRKYGSAFFCPAPPDTFMPAHSSVPLDIEQYACRRHSIVARLKAPPCFQISEKILTSPSYWLGRDDRFIEEINAQTN